MQFGDLKGVVVGCLKDEKYILPADVKWKAEDEDLLSDKHVHLFIYSGSGHVQRVRVCAMWDTL